LLCHLLDIDSSLELIKQPRYGNIYETFVVGEIKKSFINNNEDMDLFYLQDKDMSNKEIDVIIEKGGKIYPIEIKSASIINRSYFSNIKLLDKIIDKKIMPMIVVGTNEILMKLDNDKIAFPAWML
jgi:predicted AAA+ superfamily ATPase